jgi:hypothetical protein
VTPVVVGVYLRLPSGAVVRVVSVAEGEAVCDGVVKLRGETVFTVRWLSRVAVRVK